METLIAGAHHDPHSLLGAHPDGDHTVIRTLRRTAQRVSVLADGHAVRMSRVHPEGIFEATLPGLVTDYRLEVDGTRVDDPYRHLPTVGEMDLYLIREGRHEKLWTVLGAHVRDGGAAFAVWAPNAAGIRLVGDFSGWGPNDGWPMRSLGSSGVWELYVPGAKRGDRYKFRILGARGWIEKADPMAASAEVAPASASVIYQSHYPWSDEEWVTRRAATRPYEAPMSVYEVHLGSWRPGLSYPQLAEELTAYVTEMGFTHVELMPVMEHPYGGSWGYQVTGYYAPTARFGTPDDFRYLVDRLHNAGIGVILDWVPAHFPKDAWALALFDGTPLYEHPDPRRGEHPDWGSLVFNYGRPEVRNFLVANALYWCEEFHVDGLRVDAVASMLYLDYSRENGEWEPNRYGGRENLEAISFLQEASATVYKLFPGVAIIAEESTAFPGVTRATSDGGLGFGFKWNMGWMHDTLNYLSKEPIFRRYHHNQLTFSLAYAWSENYVLPISHDEVVHGKGSLAGKMPGDTWQRLANLRALLAYMWAHPGKQLLFMGSELADDREWSEQRGLDWGLLRDPARAGVARLVADLNAAYQRTPALWRRDTDPGGFAWLDADDALANTLAFVRYAERGAPPLVCVANFSAIPRGNYRLGLPHAGRWREVVNTDAGTYGGSGVGNLGVVTAEAVGAQGMPASALLRVPPLGVLWFAPVADDVAADQSAVDEDAADRVRASEGTAAASAADQDAAAPVPPGREVAGSGPSIEV